MLLLTLIVTWAFALAASKCGLYLIPSTIQNAGRGIAAGISYESEFEIESNPTLPIPKTLTRQTQLTHYVYGTGNDRYDMMMIGPASIYNHHEQRTVYYTWKDHNVSDPSLLLTPHANFTHTVFRTSRKIEKRVTQALCLLRRAVRPGDTGCSDDCCCSRLRITSFFAPARV